MSKQILKKKLANWQKHDVNLMVEFYKKNFDADDPKSIKGQYLGHGCGVGKSPISMASAHEILKTKPLKKGKKHLVCIVTLPKMYDAWKDKANEWLPDSSKRNYGVWLTTYEMIKDNYYRKKLISAKPDITILDEGHAIKTPTSQRTLATIGDIKNIRSQKQSLTYNSDYLIYASASPMPSRVGELYCALYSMRVPEVMNKTYQEFINLYAEKSRPFKDTVLHEGLNLKKGSELIKVIKKYFLVRELIDVWDGPDPRNYYNVDITLNLDLFSENQALVNELEEILGEKYLDGFPPKIILKNPQLLNSLLSAQPSFEKMTNYRHYQTLAKVPQVCEKIVHNYRNNKKIYCTVATQFVEPALRYFDFLKNKFPKVPIHYLDGTVSPSERYDTIEYFNNAKKGILVTTQGAIREGLDLNNVPDHHIVDLDWVPGNLIQYEGRAFRFNTPKKAKINYYYYPANDGMELYMSNKLSEKRKTIAKVFSLVKTNLYKKVYK